MNETQQFVLLLMLTASVMLHFCAAFFSLRLMRMSRMRWAWILISASLVLMAVRRAVYFYHLMGGAARSPLDFSSESILFFIPLLLVAGLLALAPLVHRMESSTNLSGSERSAGSAGSDLFEQTTDGVLVFEAADQGRRFVIREINPAAERIEKTVRQYVTGHTLTEALPAFARAGLPERLYEVWKTGKAEPFQMCAADEENGSFWREGRLYRRSRSEVVAVYREISDRIRLQQELAKCRQELELLFQAAPLACQRLDPEGTILDVNPAWVRLTGAAPDSAAGRPFSEWLSRAGRSLFQESFDALHKEGSSTLAELELCRSDGGRIGVRLEMTPLGDASGRIEEVLCILRAGSDPKMAAESTEAAEKASLEAAERLSGERRELQRRRLTLLGELIGGISRELNTPLTTARNAFNLMRESIDSSAPQVEFTEIASRELTRMADLIEQMCRFSNPAGSEVEKLNLNALLDNALTMVRSDMRERRIQLCDERAEGLPPVFLPPGGVMTVVLNPIRNSVEALESGGVLTLRTGAAGQGGVFIEIEDNGPGISKEFLPHLFEPFMTFRLHNRSEHGGLGLGMAQVRYVLDILGGSIDVRSDEGFGTCVRIVLPVRTPAPA